MSRIENIYCIMYHINVVDLNPVLQKGSVFQTLDVEYYFVWDNIIFLFSRFHFQSNFKY